MLVRVYSDKSSHDNSRSAEIGDDIDNLDIDINHNISILHFKDFKYSLIEI